MPRLSAVQGNVGLILLVTIGSWWLASAALEIGSGVDDVAGVSARGTMVLVISQWLAIALFAPHASASMSENNQSAATNLLSVTVPLWPLLAVLWLSSRVSLVVIIGSQLGAMALAGSLVLIARLAARATTDAELAHLLSVAIGLVAAVVIWVGRASLAAWMLP